MPFGLTNSPATFQRLMERCLGDMQPQECLVYLDDIIVYSSTIEEHMRRLEAVFQKLKDFGLKLKPSKCHFLKSEVTYLGHVVSKDGVHTDPEKIKAVQNWSTPKNVKELQQFLGFVGFYRRFVKGFSSIASPLHLLLRGHLNNSKKKKKIQPAEFVWGPKQQRSFEELKTVLTTAPILGFADYHSPFELHIDASMQGLGAVLYQIQDNQPRVISYASRGLKPSEQNYPAHKLEFLALKWAVTDKFSDFLYGQKFKVLTDNNPLTYVLSSARLDATGHRWLAKLAVYDFALEYKTGKTNTDADALSRLPRVSNAVVKAVCHSVSEDPFIFSLASSASSMDSLRPPQDFVTPIDTFEAQSKDSDIKWTVDHLLAGRKPKLKLQQGVLFRAIQTDAEEIRQLVVPKNLRQQILTKLHDDIGHPGRDKTQQLLKSRFFWPGMSTSVEQHVSGCHRCVCRKGASQSAPLVPILTFQPLELVCIDYLLIEPSGGYEHLLVIVDHFTKFARVVPTKNETAKTTAKALLENFINLYGYPSRIHSDQGRNFESHVIQELCALTGIDKSRTTSYHPRGNGACERMNQTLLKVLGTLEEDKKGRWKDYMNTLVLAYNCTPHDATGFMFGRTPRLPVDQQFQTWSRGNQEDLSVYISDVR